MASGGPIMNGFARFSELLTVKLAE